MTITDRPTLRHAVVIPELGEAWTLYASIFRDIDELAAQRHLMTHAEFASIYQNPAVRKFYAYDTDGYVVGMSVITQHLHAWPLISPGYFARRWPDLFVRQAIWYVGFVGVRPHHAHAFRHLINEMYPHVAANNGVAVMDFCTFNVCVRRLPEITLQLLCRINAAATMETTDAQTFVAYRFDKGDR